jgi:pyruvate-formate lyase-activating enzyme
VLLDRAHERDGVSILGGEPFQQPEGLLALVRALRARGCDHILCYSGYTHRALRRRGERRHTMDAVLAEIDMLVDGPFVAALADDAGPWTGSGNQRVMAAVSSAERAKALLGASAPPIQWNGDLGRTCGRGYPGAS